METFEQQVFHRVPSICSARAMRDVTSGLERPWYCASHSEHLHRPDIARRQDQADHKPRDQSAHVRRHAYLRSGNIEDRLNDNDDDDVLQASTGKREMTISQKKTGPCSDDAHNTAGCPDDFFGGC